MKTILEGLLLISFLDCFSYFLTYYLTNKKPHHNSRWFFIHFVVNGLVSYYNFNDLKYCLNNIENCSLQYADDDAYFATQLVIILHFYHMIIFLEYLTYDDWLHHLTMCVFNGYVFYYQHLKIQSVTAYFCSGFPGMIDYFLLYLVKINYINKKIEKDVYLFLSSYIRSPGCVLTTLLAVPYFFREQTYFDFVLSFFSISLVFWNGQYYMKKTCIDYGKKYKN